MNVVELFPTKIALFKLPAELSTVCNHFNEAPMEVDKFPNTHSKERDENFLKYGLHSKDTYIMDGDECKEISKFVLECVDKYNNDVLGYITDGWQFSQSWVSLKYPGQQHVEHTHPNSIVSAVIFWGSMEEKTSPLLFHSPAMFYRQNTIMNPIANDPKYTHPMAIEQLNFSPGDLILFPSYLPHSVPENKTRMVRKSLSMNIVPKGKFGDNGSLTELLFDRLK